MKKKKCFQGNVVARGMVVLVAATSLSIAAAAQDGNVGINEANTLIRGYYTTAEDLMFAIGGIMGLIGGIKVYNMIVHGRHESWQALAAWFGGCIFLVVVGLVIKSFFGL